MGIPQRRHYSSRARCARPGAMDRGPPRICAEAARERYLLSRGLRFELVWSHRRCSVSSTLGSSLVVALELPVYGVTVLCPLLLRFHCMVESVAFVTHVH